MCSALTKSHNHSLQQPAGSLARRSSLSSSVRSHRMGVRGAILLMSLFVAGHSTADGAAFEFMRINVASTSHNVIQLFPAAKAGADGQYFRFPDTVGDIAFIAIFPSRKLVGYRPPTSCRTIFDQIYESYGGPHMVQKYNEAQTRIHRRVWILGTERMALRCYRRQNKRLAERVEFYHYPEGKT